MVCCNSNPKQSGRSLSSKILILIIFILSLSVISLITSSCSNMKVQSFADKKPEFIPELFFIGKTTGTGQFWDRFNKLSLSFSVELDGKWDGKFLILDEILRYDSGETFNRQYKIEKIDRHLYTVESVDLAEKGTIEAYGNTLKWTYTLKQKIGDRTINLNFNDWMFLQPNGIVLNRAFAEKFRLGVGEVIMSIQKN